MAQHDYNIANQLSANLRADLNNALSAIASNNSGTSAPTTTFANQWWYDTTNDLLKIRNEADTGWITVGYLDQTGSEWQPYIGGTKVTDFLDEDNMSSDSATAVPSQQSVKAYVDSTATQWLTDQATTSGTAFDFSVPSTAREITVHFCGTSLDVAGYFLVQLMVSGSPITSGYTSASSSSGTDSYRTDGFHVFRSNAAHVSGGRMDVCRVGSGAWSASHSVSISGAETNGGGFITGVGTVTGIRVTRTTGNFDAGLVNVSYR